MSECSVHKSKLNCESHENKTVTIEKIIDIDDAIANGYVKLSKTIEDIMSNPQNAKKAGEK